VGDETSAHLRHGVWGLQQRNQFWGKLKQAAMLHLMGDGEGHAAVCLLRRHRARGGVVGEAVTATMRCVLFAGCCSREALQGHASGPKCLQPAVRSPGTPVCDRRT